MFSFEICEIFKSIFFYRTPTGAVSVNNLFNSVSSQGILSSQIVSLTEKVITVESVIKENKESNADVLQNTQVFLKFSQFSQKSTFAGVSF